MSRTSAERWGRISGLVHRLRAQVDANRDLDALASESGRGDGLLRQLAMLDAEIEREADRLTSELLLTAHTVRCAKERLRGA